MFELYHCDSSYASQIVRLYFSEYNIAYIPKHLDLRAQEHITSDYRLINPKGTVPCLVDKDHIISGSTGIMDYVTRKSLNILVGNHQNYKKILETCKTFEGIHDPHLRLLSYIKLFKPIMDSNNTSRDELIAAAKNHPWKQRRDFLLMIINDAVPSDLIESAKLAIQKQLKTLNDHCHSRKTKFMLSDSYSPADAALTAFMFRVEKLNISNDKHELPAIYEYYNQLTHRINFSNANMK